MRKAQPKIILSVNFSRKSNNTKSFLFFSQWKSTLLSLHIYSTPCPPPLSLLRKNPKKLSLCIKMFAHIPKKKTYWAWCSFWWWYEGSIIYSCLYPAMPSLFEMNSQYLQLISMDKATNRLCDSAVYCLLIFTFISSWSLWKINSMSGNMSFSTFIYQKK